jgi:hypothetical protein
MVRLAAIASGLLTLGVLLVLDDVGVHLDLEGVLGLALVCGVIAALR